MVSGSLFRACMERARRRAVAASISSVANGSTDVQTVPSNGEGCETSSFPVAHGAGGNGGEDAENHSMLSGNHSVHNVLTLANRASIVKFMLEEVRDHENKRICSKAVQKFPIFSVVPTVPTTCGH